MDCVAAGRRRRVVRAALIVSMLVNVVAIVGLIRQTLRTAAIEDYWNRSMTEARDQERVSEENRRADEAAHAAVAISLGAIGREIMEGRSGQAESARVQSLIDDLIERGTS